MSQESQQPASITELSPLQQSYYVIRRLKASLEETERRRTEPIAIVGAGCRFPGGAVDMESYWRVLREGADAVREVPRERWDIATYYDPDPAAPGKTATRHAAFLDQVDQFDPLFFGISPREAVSLDPQQRLLLELSWEALERSGHAPDRLAADRTGVFVGIGQVDYAQLLMNAAQGVPMDVYAATGNGFCYASGRLSYVLGLRGPNLAVDTACSSSLVAVHLACQSLRSRECDLALAGGVQLMLTTQAFVGLTKLGAISTDGRCKTFDASADGYGRGEGGGVIVLKRLSDALADGDQIAALIRGSAVNHDGSSSGFIVPNGLAQQEVLRQALDNAGLKPAEVGFVETHGTGTQLGDPIEVEALAGVFARDRLPASPLIIGSVKTNIGHLEAAAGIAGLLKVVLALQHREIPPHLNLRTPSPHIHWNQLPVKVPTVPTRWETQHLKRVAGVSSFGMSGTNAHVVLEEAPAVEPRPAFVDRTRHLLPLSARTPKALAEIVKRSEVFLAANPDTSLGDFCFTSATGRVHLQCRAAVVGASVSEMRERLAALVPSEQGESDSRQPARIAFLFTGQGAQFVGMGRSLYRTQPSFRATVDRCAELLRPHMDRPLLDVLYPEIGVQSPLHETAYTQPALFTLEYALARLWMSWGVQPGIMMGHSVGEYVAACLAGVFSLEDGLKLIARRAQLMQSLPRGGAMAVVFADARSAEAVVSAEADRVSVAAVNGQDNTVISGDGEAVARALAALERSGIHATRLQVSHAFHSPLMEPMLAEFERVAREVQYQSPRQPIVSNLEGQLAGPEIATPAYWVQHVRRPVQFAAGMATLERQGYTAFVEVGPKPTLLGMGRRCVGEAHALWLPSLSEGHEDWQVLLQSVATLYEHRVPIDWLAFDSDYDRRRMTLPTYPFQRRRYWLELNAGQPVPALAAAGSTAVHPLLGARLRLPLSRETRFETRFSLASPAFLQDHQLFDTVVVPGAAHVGMVLSAAHEASLSDVCVLEDLVFPQALVLNEERSATVQTILMPDGDTTAARVVSLAAGADEEDPDAWTVHLTGRLRSTASERESTPAESLDALRASCPHELSAADFYSTFRHAGYGLGPSFQWLESIWQGDGEAVARIKVPDLSGPLAGYRLHPGLIDSCFQLSAACWRGADIQADGDEIYIPFTIARFQCYRAHREGELWCHTRIRKDVTIAEGTSIADTRLFDDRGRLVAEIIGRESRKASRKRLFGSLQGSLHDALYELVWRAAPAIAEQPPAGRWLVLWPGDPAGVQLLDLLRERGDECIAVQPGQTFERLDANHFRLSPDNPADFTRLFNELGSTECSGIVHLWSVEDGCASALHLVRGLAGAGWQQAPRVWLVTRNGVAVGPEPGPLALEHSSLWGLGRVIALEHPQLRCVRVDLDIPVDGDDARRLIAELAASGQEDQVAFRAGQRYVARLARLADTPEQIQPDRPAGPYKLAMSAFGVLDELRLLSTTRRKPGRGEVEIAVRVTGLNLRDVLLALGMFNDQLEAVGIRTASQVPFGFECAGEISAVGEGVDHVKLGDEVMALTLGGMNSHVIVDARLVFAKPAGLSFEQTATIPLAFVTAQWGLQHLARLQPGERVLIHAAAGGVGQAAVQFARRMGAEIFATASPVKWDYLAGQGIRHVMSSRTLDFADRIMELTGGRGVDCVLNSLTGEFIDKSLGVVAEGGRFIELGRIGIWTEKEIHQVRPDVRYFNFDMAQICHDDPSLVASLFDDLTVQFRDHTLAPIVHHEFPIQDAAAAFRFMAQAKHIGKVVLGHPRQEPDSAQARGMIRSEGAYVVTGGLGSLGMQAAEWMVGKGARKLVLAGRSAPSETANEAIDRLRQAGATVTVVQADVSERVAVERVLGEAATLGPVNGIVHAAGVLDDGILLNLEWPRFRKVMAPKVDGAWNLHELSLDMPLDFFICYSSMASLLGSPGQGNYAAANAFLDALAHHRRALGLPAMTINWGPWAGTGMAGRMDRRAGAAWGAQGVDLVQPELALDLLEQLWARNVVQVGVQPLNWSKFLRQFPAGSQPPLLEAFSHEDGRAPAEKSKFLETLENTPLPERLGVLQDEIRVQIASVLGVVSLDDIELRAPLFNLGLDSLMAVEVKNRLERTLSCSMRPTLVFDYPTVEALAGYFAQEPLVALFAPPSETPHAGGVPEDEHAIADELALELLDLEQAGRR